LFEALRKEESKTVRQIIKTEDAPQAIGPYSQAVAAGGFVFLSGQIPLDPATGQFVEGGIAEQTEQVLRNLSKVLEAAGTSLARVVKTTVFLADMSDFAAMNEVYGRFFSENAPARSTVQAARLPRDARVEIDVIALAGEGVRIEAG
jgi:2-iminobutanoate/2-iminopropanoate deaminase